MNYKNGDKVVTTGKAPLDNTKWVKAGLKGTVVGRDTDGKYKVKIDGETEPWYLAEHEIKKNEGAEVKAVKVEGCFTEWYAPTFKDPYEDNAEYAEFYDEKILNWQPVIGPAVDGKDEYLSGDLGCLADRITCDAYDIGKWEEAKNGFADAVEKALATGEPQTFKFEGLDDIKITPYAEVPVIPDNAYEVYGKFAGLVKERVAAI